MSSKKRYRELDALRGIAAMVVLFYHYTYHYRGHYGHAISPAFDFYYGSYGVELFFIISGFVIYLTIERVKSPFEFAYKRFSRLYPTYWFCLICTAFVVNYFGLPNNEAGWKEVLVGLTMVQKLFDVNPVDDSYWSLLPELIFYGFMFTLLLFKKIDQVKLFFSIWVGIMILNSFLKIPYITTLFNLRYGMLFFAGILYYQIRKGDNRIINHLLIGYCLIAVALINKDLVGVMVVASFFAIFYLVSYDKLAFIAFQPFLFLGKISYALYLLHQFIGYVILNHLREFGIQNPVILLAVPTSIIILLAWIVTDYLEKPSIRYLREHYDSIKTIWFNKFHKT